MGVERVPKIFINYRQEDTSGHVHSLYETLARRFGAEHVFHDLPNLSPGEVFDATIKARIDSADVFLAVIGKHWLALTEKKRSAGEEDYARMEIAMALRRGPGVMVVPVLVEGARVPRRRDLPANLQGLVGRHAVHLSNGRWARDVGQLVEYLEKAFGMSGGGRPDIAPPAVTSGVPNSLYSLFGGSLAGLVTGTIVGASYTLSQGVERWRIILIGLYGLLVGAMQSYFINTGMEWCARHLRGAPWSRVIGGTAGGALGGIVAAVLGGIGFAWLKGGAVNPVLVAAAVSLSTVFITLGVLLPDLLERWRRREWHILALVVIILVCVAVVCLLTARWLLSERLPLETPLEESQGPTSPGVLMLGLLCGVMSGLQAGAALFTYDRFKTKPSRIDH